MHVKTGDEFSQRIKTMIDEYINKQQLHVPLAEADDFDLPDANADCVSNADSLNLKQHAITTVIWSTGFTGDFSYLKLPVLDESGMPKHTSGVSEIEGFYFIGFPWLRKRKSGIILGVAEDAAYITSRILAFSTSRDQQSQPAE